MALRIRDQAKSTLAAASVLAALVFAAAVYLLMVGKRGDSPTWVIILFYTMIGGFGLLPAAAVAILARHARRFGRGTLVLKSTPLQPGGPLLGEIQITRRLENVLGFRVTLAFVNMHFLSEHKSEEVLWTDAITIDAKDVLFRARETIVPINLTIPDRPPVRKSPLSGYPRWKLTLEALPKAAPYFTAEFYLPLDADAFA